MIVCMNAWTDEAVCPQCSPGIVAGALPEITVIRGRRQTDNQWEVKNRITHSTAES